MDNHYAEHPLDVIKFFLACSKIEPSALIILEYTFGGSVRSPGALMAVSQSGKSSGYISGGCIDADLILQAQTSLRLNQPRKLIYGIGSPFIDLPLPCGGAIHVRVLPEPDIETLKGVFERLSNRRTVRILLSDNHLIQMDNTDVEFCDGFRAFLYEPKLRLRIAGKGADCLALCRIAQASNIETILQLTTDEDIAAARSQGLSDIQHLKSISDVTSTSDDPWTAFALTFHDRDWEVPLLQSALSGSAFYVGAVGSRKTHEARVQALMEAGMNIRDIERIHAPIGLVPSLRDASSLAISALAEIIDAFTKRLEVMKQSTAVVLLAAGEASRFSEGDKLLAKLHEKPLLSHFGFLTKDKHFARSLAVTRPEDTDRQSLLKNDGWEICENDQANTGQASSILCGLRALQNDPNIRKIIILLADMPLVSKQHIEDMIMLGWNRSHLIMSHNGQHITPPVLIDASDIDQLLRLTGDKGARALLSEKKDRSFVRISKVECRDIDTLEDLKAVSLLLKKD